MTEAPKSRRPRKSYGQRELVEGDLLSPTTDPLEFPDVEHVLKKGLRVVPVVTGAVVDPAGTFLFYVDGHSDERSAVQAQLNHLLDCGPSREEHLARARARAQHLAEKLSKPR